MAPMDVDLYCSDDFCIVEGTYFDIRAQTLQFFFSKYEISYLIWVSISIGNRPIVISLFTIEIKTQIIKGVQKIKNFLMSFSS